MRQALDKDELQEIEEEEIKRALGENSNIVQCPCGNYMEVSRGVIDFNARDDKGQVMSPEACDNMARNRVRCRECDTTLCMSCHERPYHLGMTCK